MEMNWRIGAAASLLAVSGTVGVIVAVSAQAHSSVASVTVQPLPKTNANTTQIAGVNPGANATNYAGYKQAQDLKPEKFTPAQRQQMLHPTDLQLLGGGGCTKGYGGPHQLCLPITPPAAGAMEMTVQEMPWTCSQVLPLLPNGIPLNHKGVDPAHLDSNGDGIACDKGDK